MGLMQEYKTLRRRNRACRQRQAYDKSFPWFYGEESIVMVTNAKDLKSDQKFKTEIVETGSGHSVGLLFEMAGKKLITKIKCPLCGKIANFNRHWQGFICDEAVWEVVRD